MELHLGTASTHPALPMASNLRRTSQSAPAARTLVQTGISRDWRHMLPTLVGPALTLRELRASDAASLVALLATEEVARYVSPPPTTEAGFERFIAWTLEACAQGTYACFAVVPRGLDQAVGIFQVRALDRDFQMAEWGFVLGAPFWGTGLFMEGAIATVDFAVEVVGVTRLEARAVTLNGRGNGALMKLGAVREAVLRHSFVKDRRAYDQHLWAILAEDWRARRLSFEPDNRRRRLLVS